MKFNMILKTYNLSVNFFQGWNLMMDWPYVKVFGHLFLVCGLALLVEKFQYNLCKRSKTNIWFRVYIH
jgi:hypothetical protein